VDLLFDLDGTLTDPGVGITRCLQHAMSVLGREPPAMGELLGFIGLPLRATFSQLLATADGGLVSRAIALYRERFVEAGMFENEVYPDVAPVLQELLAGGHRLWVVTSKPEVYARKIIDHFGLSSWFSEIYGSELDGRNSDKADLVRVVLEKEAMVPGATWMIGDRAHDVRGGRRNATRTAGVLWGYGSEQELRAEGPDVLVESMAALLAHMCARPGGERYRPDE
jgi:phosphoglycolate phosphatase